MRIRVDAPSSPFDPVKLAAGIARLQHAGVVVTNAGHAPLGQHAYLNGDDAQRRASLEDALHSDVDVVWLARGGYGLTRIVDDLRLPTRMPIVVGFSDSTALFGRLARAGLLHRAVHGPLATTLAGETDEAFARVLTVLRGEGTSVGGLHALTTQRVFDVDGPVFAGNLCVLAHLVGTRSMPAWRDHIVVLEEVGERPYRIDRMLTQLRLAGAFDGVRAIVVGQLTRCEEPASNTLPGRDAAPSALDVFRERLGDLGVPVVAGAPVGHDVGNLALPLARRARLVGTVDGAVLDIDGIAAGIA